ncbi:hypothetical protein [Frigidibacter oleivorans]|uniref:hypothetical protein n=1 Tax=Frigidibacter oleivorans TaxID=2487129 RepID=UPI000F8F49BC|nr:hypothetical protein [Frigidibacter oleivorans]
MGSKSRIEQKLRQSDSYRAIAAFLDALGWRFETHGPSGHGHPYLMIRLPCGGMLRHTIACTPRAGGNPKGALSHLRRVLRDHGYDVG